MAKRKHKIKFHYYKGLKCQGKKELRYLKECERFGWNLPIKPERISTPYGYYTPDFEHEETFVEIKSKGTFEVMLGLKSFMNKGVASNKQWLKIKWVAKNVKPVYIRVYLGRRDVKVNYNIQEEGVKIQFLGGYIKKK